MGLLVWFGDRGGDGVVEGDGKLASPEAAG